MTTCAICQRNQTTYSINIPVDYDPEISATKHVCGSCCDIIATLAARPLLVEIEARLARLEVFTGMVAPAPLPIDDSAPAVTFAEPDNRFEVTGWDEPTADEVTRFWSDENADERADVIREARYGKQL